ncbi:MAG: CapA family protein [Candidatus Kapaibacterium sp.]
MSIAILGDVSFNGLIHSQPEFNTTRFQNISKLLKNYSVVTANLESPIKNGIEVNEYKEIINYSNYEVTKYLLKFLNINCLTLANNHIYDYKMSGLIATINLLDELKILHTGAGWKEQHLDPIVLNYQHETIYIFSYVDLSTNPKTENYTDLYINYFNKENAIKDIKKYKQDKKDKVIFNIHWGVDYSRYYTKEQQSHARELINNGVDLLIGHHSHTIQPYELFKEKPIFYNMGQLCYGDFIWEGKLRSLRTKTKTGIILIINENINIETIIPTKELIGNYIILPGINIIRKLKLLRYVNILKNKTRVFSLIIILKETLWDRLFDYFCGYYRSPLNNLLNLSNLKKISIIIKDFKKHLNIL